MLVLQIMKERLSMLLLSSIVRLHRWNSRRGFLRATSSAAVAILTFLAAGTADLRAETPPKTIRIAGVGNPAGKPFGTGTIGVLKAKGWLEEEFKKDGVTIEWQFPRGTGPAINEGFANGQIDFANYGGLPNIVGRGAGLRTKVIASYGVAPTYLIARNNSGIEKIEDIKGHRISVSRGTINQLALGAVLERLNLTEKDIQLFDLLTGDQISALQSGDIDALVGTASALSVAENGFGKVVFTTKGRLDPAASFGSFIVTEDFARKYPETTRRVVKAYVKAASYSSQEEHRSELYDIWALAGQTREAIAKDYDGDSLADRLAPLLDDFYVANAKRAVKFSVDNKLIKKEFDVESWIDRKPLQEAIKSLGYEGSWKPHDAKGEPQG
jgi:sulfonate transport system substrate-binding protein